VTGTVLTSSADQDEHLLVRRDEIDDAVAIVTLNRPQRLNALTVELVRQLQETAALLDADASVRCIVLTGAGGAFSAGSDLRGPALGAETVLRDYYNPLVRALISAGTPLVAAVNGVSAGAGVSLCLACDIRVAAATATFRMAFVRVGLVPDAGATWLLPRAVGPARAAEMALTGRAVSAAEAHSWGLVNEVSPDSDALPRALEMARLIAAQSSSTGAIRQLLRGAVDSTLEEALEAEVVTQIAAQQGPDWSEAVAAFAAKRPPQFR
jgi:2-(1,2-epoxy-1,2-dihydrophenyl)acetyl-CoA isomerase